MTAAPMETTRRRTLPADVALALRRSRQGRGLGLRAGARAVGIGHGFLHALEAGTRCPSALVAELLIARLNLDEELSWRLRTLAAIDAGRSSPGQRGAM